MTKYTDTRGKQTVLCDQCRRDMPIGTPAFTLAPGTVAEGYINRDYLKGEMVLCPECTHVVGEGLARLGMKWADSLIPVPEAA